MPRKNITRWGDLYDYGIRHLTGESDPLHLRGLCDLTQEGKEIIESFLGVNGIQYFPNWNSGAVASVLLPYGILKDLALFIFFQIDKVDAVVDDGHGIFVTQYSDKYEDIVGFRMIRNPNPSGKERNEHQFTGRTV
jgi:hypothetical protein